jgi:transcriptional regulator with XRE-family HTH domain
MAAGLTQEQLAAKLQIAGLHSMDRVAVAKIESQIRSLFDFELALFARVLETDPASLLPSRKALQNDLDSLIEGQR